MSLATLQLAHAQAAPPRPTSSGALPAPRPLAPGDADEVLDFLAARPVHTVGMAGLVRDNGLVSPHNRGTFYACRDRRGRLEGVALIGHAVLVEARAEGAAAAFARLAQRHPNAHMILGEGHTVELFWNHYAGGGQEPRRLCRELLLEQHWPVEVREAVSDLRLATPDDLETLLPVHAQMAFEESGVDPLAADPEGFRARCALRVERGRTWVARSRGRLLFKADVVADTPEATYVEGIYVAPAARGRGYGLRCLSQLTRSLLRRSASVCLFVNEQNAAARAFYQRAGYRQLGVYDTIFLKQ
jgi:predicted GNAT family acetyltransferase